VAANLRLLSVGLNPSLPSVAAGFYFANPRNRFWKALNASSLVTESVEPGIPAMRVLLEREAMGFTDLVKRPTRGAADLRAADYRAGAPRLLTLIERYQPVCAWFHGKVAYSQFLRYAETPTRDIGWGKQRQRIGDTWVYVTPNPSPANAAWSLGDLVDWYNRLAQRLTAD
jgi:TDG/mug DNA glycosylase family protein